LPAIASLPVAVFASPCVLSQVPGLNGGHWFYPFMILAMIIAVGLPIVALVDIARSDGARSGRGFAIVALSIAVLTWGALILLLAVFGSDPYWHG
jgi:hypothetical protein